MFLENSDFDGLQRLILPKIVWSSALQQVVVKGLHGFEFEFEFEFFLSFIFLAGKWKERIQKRSGGMDD